VVKRIDTTVKRIDTTARKRRTQAGTSVVEATIVFPLMLLLVFGIGEFGIAFTQWNSLTNAVREGARTGVVFRSPCDSVAVTSLVKTTVENFASSSGIDPVNITTTVSPTCQPTGTSLTVTATLPFNYIALDALAGLAPSTNLTARSVMRSE
jgi:Flp pilus assembly protein TadG